MKFSFIMVISSLASGCILSTANAQETETEDHSCLASGEGKKLDDEEKCIEASSLLGLLDLATPENALFSLLGSAPDNVIRPKVGDKISLSLLPQVADAFSNDGYAIGFEVNPGLMMMPTEYTTADLLDKASTWQGSGERRRKLQNAKMLSQFTISGAATKITDGQKLFKAGLGLNFNHDTGAPLNSAAGYGNCIENESLNSTISAATYARELSSRVREKQLELIQSGVAGPKALTQADTYIRKSDWFKNIYQKSIQKIIQRCAKEASPWNRPVYGGGIAIYHSELDNPSPMPAGTEALKKQTGYGAWGSIVRPLGDNGQFTFGATFNDDLIRERKEGEDTITESVDSWRIGGRYTHQVSSSPSNDRAVRGFIEAAHTEEKFGMIQDKFTQAGIGVEVQLQKNLFFQATIGDTFGSEIDRSTYLSGQLKWSFSKIAAE